MAKKSEQKSKIKAPSMIDALIPIITLFILLVAAVYLYGGNAASGAFQIALVLFATVAGLVARKNGHSYASIGKAAVDGVSTAMGAIFILLAVGSLIGAWSMSGTIATGYAGLDNLFSRGGMESMLGTVWLIITAMAFGGVMEYTGMLARLIKPLIDRAKSDKSLLIATGLTAIGINVVAADQYMSIVLTGNLYKREYENRGIAPWTLSRQIEDTGTVTSPLIPWNSCGAYMSATLGIAIAAYFPFAFFNLINPILSFIWVCPFSVGTGWGATTCGRLLRRSACADRMAQLI